MKRCDALLKINKYIPETDDVDERYKLVLERLDPTSEKARKHLKDDAAKRLQWFKNRVAKDFEQNVFAAIGLFATHAHAFERLRSTLNLWKRNPAEETERSHALVEFDTESRSDCGRRG
jgi:hypothetical protein